MFLDLTITLGLLSTVVAATSQWTVSNPLLVNVPLSKSGSQSKATTSNGWTIELRSSWDILGPFPQHAREQHLLSPSYPLDLSEGWKVDWNEAYPSSLADGGLVRWTRTSAVNGNLDVMFPEIRWKELRSTEGWAALQHHALLHSHLTITPPEEYDGDPLEVPALITDVLSISYFSIIPYGTPGNYTPKWHTGNIYNLPNTPTQVVRLPTAPAANQSTTYHIVASGDYEIRLFGDPVEVEGQETPIQKLQFGLSLQDAEESIPVVLEQQMDVVPDFVGGWIFSGDGAIGVGVKALDGWWKVSSVIVNGSEFSPSLASNLFRLGPQQSRTIPIKISQNNVYLGDSLSITLSFKRVKVRDEKSTITKTFTLTTTIPIRHKEIWTSSQEVEAYRGTYFLGSMPFWYMAKPPKYCDCASPSILALHGAGVEADSPFWTRAIPQQNSSWIIYPTGRTSWGYDWHGPSTLDVWGTQSALGTTLRSRTEWKDWDTREPRVILVGHSNGGQGVWYQAARYPDRVLAAIPAASYIKSQLYISTSLSHGVHFMDATLRNILESALQPDDNDLYLTNLVSTPILSIHGGNDQNIPTWHSRQLYSDLKTWYPNANISYHEEPNKPHWWDTVLSAPYVQHFLDQAASSINGSSPIPSSFVLTTSIPEESGSLHGFRIRQLEVPGILGRLKIETISASKITVQTANIWELSVDLGQLGSTQTLLVDGARIKLGKEESTMFLSKAGKNWHKESSLVPPRPSGPLNRILAGQGPIMIVIPENSPYHLSAATRVAHTLLTYLRIDTMILFDREATKHLGKGHLGCSNIIIMGGHINTFGQHVMSGNPGAVVFTKHGWIMRGRHFELPGLGVAFLHSHPTCATGLTMFMSGTDEAGSERVFRMLPFRTGVPVPEWIITGADTDIKGAGGLLGAGYWGRYWEWGSARSWMGWT